MAKKNLSCWWGIIFTILAFLFIWFAAVLQSTAQNVTRKGNVFYQDSSSATRQKKEPTLTAYTFVDKNGITYPVYISSNGKYFIIKTSKKTGKKYRQYLPEITKQLQK